MWQPHRLDPSLHALPCHNTTATSFREIDASFTHRASPTKPRQAHHHHHHHYRRLSIRIVRIGSIPEPDRSQRHPQSGHLPRNTGRQQAARVFVIIDALRGQPFKRRPSRFKGAGGRPRPPDPSLNSSRVSCRRVNRSEYGFRIAAATRTRVVA